MIQSPRNKACLESYCQDPCREPSDPCGVNTDCETIDHRPVCQCPVGWAGNPHIQCYQSKFLLLGHILGQCLTFSSVDQCLTNADCPLTKACISDKCVDPCLSTFCGERAQCNVEFHKSHCYCPQGLQGNPLVKCLSVGCQSHSDCRKDETCDYLLHDCTPLCVDSPCAEGAYCEADNHKELCHCKLPLKGDGRVYCGRRKNKRQRYGKSA